MSRTAPLATALLSLLALGASPAHAFGSVFSPRKFTVSAAGLSLQEWQCNDGIDNDGDGDIDSLDSDCDDLGSVPTIDIGGSANPGGDDVMPIPFFFLALDDTGADATDAVSKSLGDSPVAVPFTFKAGEDVESDGILLFVFEAIKLFLFCQSNRSLPLLRLFFRSCTQLFILKLGSLCSCGNTGLVDLCALCQQRRISSLLLKPRPFCCSLLVREDLCLCLPFFLLLRLT